MIQISEFVGEGHPDKLADALAERITNTLTKEEGSRASIDVLITEGMVSVAGEVTTEKKKEEIDEKIKNNIVFFLEERGYDSAKFDIHIKVRGQSKEIQEYSKDKAGVVLSGDQSVTFGYACNSRLGSGTYMPESWEISKKIILGLRQFKWARPDSKCLVVLDKQPTKMVVERLVVSVHHSDEVDLGTIRVQVLKDLIHPIFDDLRDVVDPLDLRKVHINPAGKFTVGGLAADSGATNRKLMVDSYGCGVFHGGGGLNGKDLTKVDRLGAYFARYICKNIVAAGVCEELELGAYIRPGGDRFEFMVNRVQWSQEIDWIMGWKISRLIREVFDYSFSQIHGLFCGSNNELSSFYGHFGKHGGVCPWERLDKVDKIRDRLDSYAKGL